MKAALLAVALLGSPSVVLASDRVPHLNVEALCKATAADDQANGIVLGQSVENCMRDETNAREQLAAFWSANPGPARDQCEAEATVDENQSYVDLLTCLQSNGIGNSISPAASLRGASKNRNSK